MATVTFTNVWKDLLAQAQINDGNCLISWVAAGTGTGAPAATDTALGTEVCRVAVSSLITGAAHGELIALGQIPSSIASGTTFQEYGLFGGVTASATAGSGTLVGRFLAVQAHTNNNLQVQFDLTGT